MVMIGTLVATQIFTTGVVYSLQLGTERLGADLIVVPLGAQESAESYLITGSPQAFYMNESVLQQVEAIPGVEAASPQIFLTSISNASCCATGNLQIVGIDPQTDFTVLPWLSKPLAQTLNNSEGIVGSQVYTEFATLQPEFFGRTFDLVGVLSPTNLGLDNSFFITISAAESIIAANNAGLLPHKLPITIQPNQISDVVVKLEPGANEVYVVDDILATIPNVNVVTASDMTVQVKSELSGLLQTAYIFGGAVWAIAAIMIGAIFMMSVNERRREIGLLRSIGSTSRSLFGMITLEGAMLSVIGGLLGIVAGGFVVYVFGGFMTKALSLRFIWPALTQMGILGAEAVGVALVIGVAASIYPAYVSSKMEPYSAIREE